MSDRYTQAQYTQAEQILTSSLFTLPERRDWLLRFTAMNRFEAREALTELAAEHRKRAPREDQEAA